MKETKTRRCETGKAVHGFGVSTGGARDLRPGRSTVYGREF